MSHTTRRRFARLAAGLAVTAGATATTLLGASPAYAQTNGITISQSGGTMTIGGSDFDDVISATGGSTFRLNANRLVTATGPGCVSFGQVAQCSGVTSVRFFGGNGNDSFDNQQTSTQIRMSGGGGNDTLTGGSGADTLLGDRGVDKATGRGGKDLCIAESEVSCEL